MPETSFEFRIIINWPDEFRESLANRQRLGGLALRRCSRTCESKKRACYKRSFLFVPALCSAREIEKVLSSNLINMCLVANFLKVWNIGRYVR